MNSVTESRQDRAGIAATETNVIDLLRRFHYGEPAASAKTTAPGGDVLPALLNPYRDASTIRYQYPLYLLPPNPEPSSDKPVLARPMSEHLADSVAEFALGADDARILKDNLPWIERYLRQHLEAPDPVDAPALFAEAAAALQQHLDLESGSRDKLGADLERLREALAPGGQFLAYGPNVSLHLLVHAVRHQHEHSRERLRGKIDKRIHSLRALLDVEKSKSADAKQPGGVESSVGPGSSYFDTGALSGMLEQRVQGSVEMAAARRARIERALQELEGWQDQPVLVRFVGELQDESIGDLAVVAITGSDDPCTTAAEEFEKDAARFARLFASLRIAELESDDNYNPEVHDSWFASFDWQAFSDAELQLVTRIVALVSANHLAGDGLPSFSRLLGSRLPVHIVSWVRAYDNPGAQRGDGPFDSYRFELAYFGVGHRQVVVAQTSAARHEDLLSGFLCALNSNRASLHLVNRGTQSKTKKPLLDPWFVASAALESRAHPFVLVNPDAGDHAAERVSFDGNPQADSDWPVEKLEYRSGDGEVTEMDLAFTFADYALLMPALHDHFRRVPPGFESPDLVPVDRYLDGDSVDRSVPFVWGIDDQGVLTRLVVSRALVFACRDRLNYWRTLQELAGIHNFYVEEAIDRVINEQQAAIEAEREQLQKAHEEAIENVRSEAAGDAMGQLVDVLMGADLSDMVGTGSQIASMPASEPAAITEPGEMDVEPVAEPEPGIEEEEELSFDEPWLDTDMCTTCDDCMGVNKMMFVYNDNKQAIIRDPRAGPFADLVAAAEICPAKCIHPGKPLDPNEPGLDELIARAEPFN